MGQKSGLGKKRAGARGKQRRQCIPFRHETPCELVGSMINVSGIEIQSPRFGRCLISDRLCRRTSIVLSIDGASTV